VISTSEGESWITFSPSGDLAVFGRHANAGWNHHTIHLSRRSANGWSPPVVAPFSGTWEDRGARFSPDGRRLIFSSNRPRPGAASTGARPDLDLWIVDVAAGGWSEPRLVPAPVSSDANDFHASIAADGTIYFASSRPGGAGRSDVYRARMVPGAAPEVERLPAPVNTPLSEPDVYVDPEQRYLIIARTDDPQGRGGDDLYLVRRADDGSWSEPRNLGPLVNSDVYECGPLVSRDGRTLYFTSHRGTDANIYAIPAASVGIGRAEAGVEVPLPKD
jgi:Tol biopolymer transport system component